MAEMKDDTEDKTESKVGSAFADVEEEGEGKDDLVKGFEDQELVNMFLEMHKEAEDAFTTTKNVTDAAWNAYNNDYDFSDKADFQSKAFLPIYKTAIRVAQNLVRKTLLQSPQYFSVKGLNKETRNLETDIYQTLFRAAEQSGLREHVANSAFAAFLENLAILKIYPVPVNDEEDLIHQTQQYKCSINPISLPNDFRLDPKGRNLYLLHRSDMDLADFELLVDQGVYTKESLEAAKAEYVASEERFRQEQHEGLDSSTKPAWRKQVEIWEVWVRALCDKDGTARARNVYFAVLNRQFIAKKARKYPYEHGKPPFVWSPVADKPFSVYHENFGESVLSMLDAIIDLLNSLVDAAHNTATKGFEVSVDMVRNPSEIRAGIYGGKVVKTSGIVQPGLSVVRPFDVGSFSPDVYQFFQFMLGQFQAGIGITELLTGVPGLGDKTATEIESKTRAAMAQINQVAILLEDRLIAPALKMMFDYFVEWNPEVFGERLAFGTDRQKLRLKIQVKGISGAIEREGDLQKLLFVIKTLMGSPVATRLNWDYVGEELILKNGMDPEDLLNPKINQPMEPGTGPTPPQAEQANAEMGNVKELLQMVKPQ